MSERQVPVRYTIDGSRVHETEQAVFRDLLRYADRYLDTLPGADTREERVRALIRTIRRQYPDLNAD